MDRFGLWRAPHAQPTLLSQSYMWQNFIIRQRIIECAWRSSKIKHKLNAFCSSDDHHDSLHANPGAVYSLAEANIWSHCLHYLPLPLRPSPSHPLLPCHLPLARKHFHSLSLGLCSLIRSHVSERYRCIHQKLFVQKDCPRVALPYFRPSFTSTREQ